MEISLLENGQLLVKNHSLQSLIRHHGIIVVMPMNYHDTLINIMLPNSKSHFHVWSIFIEIKFIHFYSSDI